MASHDRVTTGAVMDPDPPEIERHPDAREIAAYLDDRLPEAEKDRLQAHLAECEECREEMVELVELIEVHEQGGRRRWTIPALLAAAAAAVALLVIVPTVREDVEAPTAFRGAEEAAEREAVREISVVAPASDRAVARAGLVFAWEPVGEDASYQLTVTDSAGVPVWSAETDGTRLAPPENAGLEPGGTYLWYVDAVLADGTTATTGVQAIQLSP